MKKGLLATALMVSALSVSNAAFSQQTNVSSIVGQTIAGQSFAGSGGALLYNSGSNKIENATFTGNTSTGENFGEAIHVTSSTLEILKSEFNGNTAYAGGAVTSGTNESNLIIEDSKFTENFAEAFGAVGIFKDATIKNTTFKGNYTTNAAEDGGGAAYFGAKAAVMTLDNATFESNTSASSGGAIGTRQAKNNDLHDAILNITNSTFTGNTAATTGGAFDNYFYNNTSVANSTFTGNKAANGGAIYNHGEKDTTGNFAKLAITGGSFNKNEATTNGGAIYNQGNLNITGSEFTNNTAGNYGGAIYNATKVGDTYTGGVANISGAKFSTNNAYIGGAIMLHQGEMNIKEGTQFIGNTADFGGAIYTSTNSNVKLNIDDTLFQDNSALGSGAVGIFSNATITNSKFINNETTATTGTGGGALYFGAKAAVLKLDNVLFQDNESATSGGAIGTRYATGNNLSDAILNITNSTFTGNTAATTGGAFDNYFYNNTSVANSTFTGNKAANGGAIYNHGDKDTKGNSANLKITGGLFENNTASKKGGAIYTESDLAISDTTFDGNKINSDSAVSGGAIFVDAIDKTIDIKNAIFTNNQALNTDSFDADGSAISVKNGIVNITGSTFENNKADWGTVYQYSSGNSTINIDNSTFKNNIARSVGGVGIFQYGNITNTIFEGNKATDANDDGAGALLVGSLSQTKLENITFTDNYSASVGGAIATRDITKGNNSAAKLDITNATFTNNSADKEGGAIYNAFYHSVNSNDNVFVSNSTFTGNKSATQGGAIYNAAADRAGHVSSIYIEDTSFTNNSANKEGGAIYSHGDITLVATNKDIVFSGNSASKGADIYMAASDKNINMTIADGRTISIDGGISGVDAGYGINITGAGTFDVKSSIDNAVMLVETATLRLGPGADVNGRNNSIILNNAHINSINNEIDTFDDGLITFQGENSISADIHLGTGKGDYYGGSIMASTASTLSLRAATRASSSAAINIEEINFIGAENASDDNISINILEALGLDDTNANVNVNLDPSNLVIGDVLTSVRYLKGTANEQGIVNFAPRGNGWRDFNSAVLAAPVAAQVGGYLNQLNSYEQAFMNLDMKMLMTKKQRQAMKLRNRYAIAEAKAPMVFSPTNLPEKKDAGWVRPYANFEKVKLDGGPNVSNVMYGTFFGADSDMYEFENGTEAQFSVYAGYNGAHQSFHGNSMWQNGGTLGMTGILYKGNAFTALTANVGASSVEASTRYGSDDFNMLTSGIASKTGYNIELADSKFIIQPNYLMSYSFVNTFDYTNAAGVRIESDPLHAIQIAPGVKFIGNLENGWQPYANVRMVWNIMDNTDFKAAQTSLPELSMKPYVEYGVGLQKRWGDRFTGFGQAMLRSGGRNGVGFSFGFRWTFGKAPATVESATPKKAIKKAKTTKVSSL